VRARRRQARPPLRKDIRLLAVAKVRMGFARAGTTRARASGTACVQLNVSEYTSWESSEGFAPLVTRGFWIDAELSHSCRRDLAGRGRAPVDSRVGAWTARSGDPKRSVDAEWRQYAGMSKACGGDCARWRQKQFGRGAVRESPARLMLDLPQDFKRLVRRTRLAIVSKIVCAS